MYPFTLGIASKIKTTQRLHIVCEHFSIFIFFATQKFFIPEINFLESILENYILWNKMLQ